jgi:hypothetical protein
MLALDGLPNLRLSQEAIDISRQYIRLLKLPEKAVTDALHVA